MPRKRLSCNIPKFTNSKSKKLLVSSGIERKKLLHFFSALLVTPVLNGNFLSFTTNNFKSNRSETVKLGPQIENQSCSN